MATTNKLSTVGYTAPRVETGRAARVVLVLLAAVLAAGTVLAAAPDDNRAVTSVSLSVNPSTVTESAGATTVTVTATADAAVESATEVRVTVGDQGTATSGTDYMAVSPFTVTIPANATVGTGTFTLKDVAGHGGRGRRDDPGVGHRRGRSGVPLRR